MAFLTSSVPPVKCFVRKEYLYDFQKGFGELEPAVWMSIKSIKGQAFRIESLLPGYGALYDKLPMSAYLWKEDCKEEELLPLETLQIWDCLSYYFTIVQKSNLKNLGCKFFGRDRKWHHGTYMFTIDHCWESTNNIDVTFSEYAEEHKSFNFIKLNNGQFATQPNNRVLFYDPSLVSANTKHPDFKVATVEYSVEKHSKWSVNDTDDFFYDLKDTEENI